MQMTQTKLKSMNKKERVVMAVTMMAIISVMMLLVVNPAFAVTNYVTTIRTTLNNMVKIVGIVFQAVGVILSVYAVGQLVLAFKNEDANSKTTASTLLVVGIILIALPGIINGLNLINMIGA